MDMMSDFDNLDVMLGNENNIPTERELTDAIEQSLAHEDADTNTYHRNEYRDFTYENDSLRQIDVSLSFELSLTNLISGCLRKWTQWCPWCIAKKQGYHYCNSWESYSRDSKYC